MLRTEKLVPLSFSAAALMASLSAPRGFHGAEGLSAFPRARLTLVSADLARAEFRAAVAAGVLPARFRAGLLAWFGHGDCAGLAYPAGAARPAHAPRARRGTSGGLPCLGGIRAAIPC